jgi:hypothetical protein
MSSGFEGDALALLRDEHEVEIETAKSAAGPRHKTTIWAVVDDQDRVLIRSYRGATARWYREAIAQPDCRLHVAGRMLAVRAVVADDADRVAACSDGLRSKYAGQAGVQSMISAHLETTLQLAPR